MSNPEPISVSESETFAWLIQNRNISVLWMVRMLVRLHGFGDLCAAYETSTREAVFKRLHLPALDAKNDTDRQALFSRLSRTLPAMERRIHRYGYGKVLQANLMLVGERLALSATERKVLALAVLLRVDDDLFAVARFGRPRGSPADQLATILGVSRSDLGVATSIKSRLRQSGLIGLTYGSPPSQTVHLERDELRKLGLSRVASLEELFKGFVRPCPETSLAPADYDHLTPGFAFVAELLKEALANKRKGVNVLLHGPPGTGKTELTRTLANSVGVALYEVSSAQENGEPLESKNRLAAVATAQHLLAGRRGLLLFDEIDAIFNDGSDLFGKPTTAEASKSWVNHLLENNRVPTIWVANQIWKMDPAFQRRFDLVIELGIPPIRQRLQLLERECGGLLNAAELRRLSHVEAATPATVARAASVMRRVKDSSLERGTLLEAVLDGTLKAQGHPTVRRSCRSIPPPGYDVTLCNASEDLGALAEGLARTNSGRIYLYGPPGTGKTAYGYWLAEQLDKPLVLKRTSDLQSPFLGVMERNLARAFEQAARDNAILQIDEVDSFLRDRQLARQAWEVSQVNEFLTQLETFEGIFIASTNLLDGVDPAALRRFDHKIKIDYMRADQTRTMLSRFLGACEIELSPQHRLRDDLKDLDHLTPGDFAVISRRHRLVAFPTAEAVIEALRNEQTLKHGVSRKIGFV